MKLSLNLDDANYLANKNKLLEELTEVLVAWGYKPKTKRYQNFHYMTEDVVWQIDRANLDFNEEESEDDDE